MGTAALTVFRRQEKKYLLSEGERQYILSRLETYMCPDEYGEYTVCNVYFDTEHDDLIRRSLEKPVFKEKLRVRSYGVPTACDPVFLEIKRKYKGVVYKRRVTLPYDCLLAYLDTGQHPLEDSQIWNEIEYCADGSVVCSFAPSKRFSHLVIVSPAIQPGESYTVQTAHFSGGTNADGLLSDAVYTEETEIGTFTAQTGSVTVGNASGSFGGGQHGGSPNGDMPQNANPPDGNAPMPNGGERPNTGNRPNRSAPPQEGGQSGGNLQNKS